MHQNEKTGDDHHGCNSHRKFETRDETVNKFIPAGASAALTGIFSRFSTFWQF
jgi:hypothetical protein